MRHHQQYQRRPLSADRHQQPIKPWRCGRFSLAAPLIMGVVNVTPDSFADGGLYAAPAAAVSHALQLLEDGAHIIDVGGESTRPGAKPVGEKEEKRRLLPVIEQLAARDIVVSADTRKATVMRAALAAGAAIINDVSGFRDEKSVAAVADSDCGLVIMHMQGTPQTMQESPSYENVVPEVADFLLGQAVRCEMAGVDKERICLDPGIGFGKTEAHNWRLLRGLRDMPAGYPLLLGVSRKSLFADSGEPAQRDFASVAAAAMLVGRGAFVIRAHNVAATRDALAIAAKFAEEEIFENLQ